MRLAECIEYLSRGKSPNYVDSSGINVINQACIYWDGINNSRVKYQNPNSTYEKAVIQNRDVLINSTGTGTLGRAAVYYDTGEIAIADSHVTIIRTDKQKLLPEFLCLYLRNARTQKDLYAKCVSGSTNQIELSKEKLLAFTIPEIPVEEQHAIVTNLGKISRIIAIRSEELSALDELIKARFVEMFGDPVTNPKRFETRLGSDVFKLSNGKFVPEGKRFEYGVPVYGGNGISWYTDKILFEKDTIVVGRVGFQSGNVHFVKGPLWISDNAMYVSDMLDEGFDLHFLYYVMEHIDFTRFQDAGDLKKITQKPFMQMHFIMPPVSMQQDYISYIAQIDKSRSVIQKSLNQTQLLFDSLMQKYFG